MTEKYPAGYWANLLDNAFKEYGPAFTTRPGKIGELFRDIIIARLRAAELEDREYSREKIICMIDNLRDLLNEKVETTRDIFLDSVEIKKVKSEVKEPPF